MRTERNTGEMTHVGLVSPEHSPVWDGTLAAYTAIRDWVGVLDDGRPRFYADGMLTSGLPDGGQLHDGTRWRAVPRGWRVARLGEQVYPEPAIVEEP